MLRWAVVFIAIAIIAVMLDVQRWKNRQGIRIKEKRDQ